MTDSESLGSLATEQINPETIDLDRRDTLAILQAMSTEDRAAVEAVRAALPQIAQAVDLVAARLSAGGRLFYVGAGTSGRLGVLDASECPPTFGVSPEMVQGIIAGGDSALRRSSEGIEDHPRLGARDILSAGAGKGDVVAGISASGRAPYVRGALAAARRNGAATIAIANHAPAAISDAADLTISLLTGPEVLAGSTRLKAGRRKTGSQHDHYRGVHPDGLRVPQLDGEPPANERQAQGPGRPDHPAGYGRERGRGAPSAAGLRAAGEGGPGDGPHGDVT